jgi:hypothetical protein
MAEYEAYFVPSLHVRNSLGGARGGSSSAMGAVSGLDETGISREVITLFSVLVITVKPDAYLKRRKQLLLSFSSCRILKICGPRDHCRMPTALSPKT